MPNSAGLSLRILGGFSFIRDGMHCDLAYEKGRALLAYLALESERLHSRSALASLFWPHLDREAALTNLRQVLHNLRQVINLPESAVSPLRVDRESIRLRMDSSLTVDAVLFSAAPVCLDQPYPAHCTLCQSQMETLAALYQGELLAGFSLPDCPEFEEWLQVQREALHLLALTLLARLSDCHEKSGAFARALPVALRFMELEPWNEEGLRRVMRLYALNGQRTAALARYESCCRLIRRDLGILPAEETRALAENIRQGDYSPYAGELAPQNAQAPVSFSERRQVTVLYCELSSPNIDDPDDALARIRAPQDMCAERIRKHSGFLVQAHGGGLLAYFGYPQASENAARQALRAALSVISCSFPGLELRIGIHTGIVISGNLQMPDAIGATSGMAIRLRQVAESGEVVISEATQLLVSGYFECRNLGARQLRGIVRPVAVFTVERENAARHRLEAQLQLSLLVGRKKELHRLLSAWEQVSLGRSITFLVQGEAGVGKSRLLHALKSALSARDIVVRELCCVPEYSQTPFYPLIDLFQQMLGFLADDPPELRFEKLVAYIVEHYQQPDSLVVPLIARMLGLPLGGSYREPALSPAKARERTLSILLERQSALAQDKPFLLIVEDIHWADPSTLELLKHFAGLRRALPILTVLTARPGFDPGWSDPMTEYLTLDALDESETRALITSLVPDMPAQTVERIVERADGVPLFAEELARSVASGVLVQDIPVTLADLLAARLDGIGPAKMMAQMAATIGREFSADLLQRLTALDRNAIVQLLEQLKAGGLLNGEDGVYQFRHALICDAAYLSQVRGERESMHRRIAAVLAAMGAAVRPEVTARHWAHAGDVSSAVACWIKAGQQALAHSACREAKSHFEAGLELVDALPEGAERLAMELDLQIGLGTAASALQGYATTTGADCFRGALDLCQRNDANPAVFHAVWRLWAGASSQSGYSRALDLAVLLLCRAESGNDPIQLQQAHFALANTLFWQGDFIRARDHLNLLEASCRPEHHEAHVAGFGEDAQITGGSYHSWVLWFLGLPDQALEKSAQTLKYARKRKHPFSLAYALTFAALLQCRMRRPEEALVLADELLGLSRRHHFPLWEVGGELARGWSMVQLGHEGSIAAMQHCVEATRTAMGGVALVVLAPLVEAQAFLRNHAAALAVCQEALTIGEALGDGHIEAELYRLQGESLLGSGTASGDEAEQAFHKAIAVARSQQARSLELRAAMSLFSLHHANGSSGPARTRLEEVFHGFSEGFDTPDLRAARTLLDAVKHS